jgi:folate-dependent phosphoribosylglycinamide formyltransferase PurN
LLEWHTDSVRISVLTLSGNRYGFKLLNLLQWNEVPVEQVVVLTDRLRSRVRWLRRAAKRIGWSEALVYAAWGLRSPFVWQGDVWRGRKLERDYRRLAKRIDYAADLRSSKAARALQAARPQLCLLAGCGIVPASLLAVPKVTTLNAHPGILPEYRGIDTALWAIYENRFDKVGCTLHVVDAGVDTGDILEARPYAWSGDETLDRLAWRLNETCLDLLAEACGHHWPAYLNRAVPQEDGRLYYLLPPRLRPAVERRLRRFLLDRPNR